MRSSFITLLVFAALFLSGCVSTKSPPETAYYTLSAETSQPSPGAGYTVGFIKVADYLETSSIILELEDSQLRPANYHRWGEPIASGIQRILEAGSQASSDNASSQPRMDVRIDRFHGSIDGIVRLEGSYTLTFDNDSSIKTHRFALKTELNQDGYPALVKALSSLATELVENIRSQI